ncbi:MAG: mannitol dehydrogenase family protein [Hyphomicrobiales bacterium]|nr:mannitol dehydrogenase family protein [Hyphomicrobiales bacterium]MDE2115763.1 mannitol dehydrogenase family protein [Hyphomicrobiales bacterium]
MTQIRLDNAHVPAAMALSYDRNQLKTGIVHLGIGAFHRAHEACYTDAVLAGGDLRWGIVGASLRAADTSLALNPQDGLYCLSIQDGAGERLQIIGAIREVLVGPEDPDRLVQAMAHPDVKIVSLTVTEKGYCHDPATGNLRLDHPDIVHDIANPTRPRSAPGYILAALAVRRANGVPAFTVLTCDNLPANGVTAKKVLEQLANAIDAGLGAYVAQNLACPSTMVDRIVPATTDADRARIAGRLGCEDAWPVVSEPFSQWVIEDDFPLGRPDWGQYGVQFVEDVAPFELMKLRMLNGSHSSIAYLGYLAGRETVSEAMAMPALRQFVGHLMTREVAPTLHVPEGTDLAAYQGDLIARFDNPALRHRTWQIAMDGSQKLPQRLLGTIRDRLQAGQAIDALTLGVAAWMRYVTGVAEDGSAIDVRDPMRAQLADCTARAGMDAGRIVNGLLEIREIFGEDLPKNTAFRQGVEAALAQLIKHGAEKTVEDFAARFSNPAV